MNRLLVIVIAFGLVVGFLAPSLPVAEPRASGPDADVLTVGPERAADSSGVPDTDASTTESLPGGSIVLERGAGGHFFAEAQVNGIPVQFLVDTGASAVALTTRDAQRVGLQFANAEFEPIGSGASGEVRGKRVTIERVSLHGKSVEGIDGAIIEGGEMSLLGQSFLSRMGAIEIKGDRMTIR